MPIGFTKTFISKQASDKQSSLDSYELEFGQGFSGGESYAEKISAKGLSFEQMEQMYIANTWVRSTVDKIVDRASDVDLIIKPLSVTEEGGGKGYGLSDETKRHIENVFEIINKPNENYESLQSIRKKIVRDSMKFDASALEIVKGEVVSDKIKKPRVELYSVPGNTIKLNVDDRGIFKKENSAYLQVDRNMKITGKWKSDELMYFILNPQSNKVYGLAAAESLVQTVTAELYANDYNLDFFYNNATPRIAVMLNDAGVGLASAAMARFKTWWDKELKGNPHRPIFLASEKGEIKLDKISMSNEDMQFQFYSLWLLVKILAVYKMQPAVLGVSNLFSTGGRISPSEQLKLFKADAVKPHLDIFVHKFNNHIIFNEEILGYDDVYVDSSLDLGDKIDQSKLYESYLRNGVMTINDIRVHGLGMVPVPWGNVPYLQNNLVPFGASRDGETSAVPMTPDDARFQAPTEPLVIPAGLTSKNHLKSYMKNYSGKPVGWEKMEIGDRMEVVQKLIRKREKELSKKFIIPKHFINAR
jgi:HK97 family phage portal protein